MPILDKNALTFSCKNNYFFQNTHVNNGSGEGYLCQKWVTLEVKK